MKVKTIRSSWLEREGRRLDCGPYLSGALEAKVRLEELACRKDRLADVTRGHGGGIYNGPQFARNFVEDPQHGVRFLGTASMLRADLSELPLLRKRDAVSSKLAYLRVSAGMTLISCSGSIGRMVYARPDMDGMWSNQDILKVVADPRKVLSGYLYAFLSGRYGVPLVTSGTYGAIIQHIEPQHVADLPVPRLGESFERHVHDLVERAATARSRAASLKAAAQNELRAELGLADLRGAPTPATYTAYSITSSSLGRLDAPHFSPPCVKAANALASSARLQRRLGDIGRVFTPGIFKRRHVEDPAFGYPYFSGSDLFLLQPVPRGFLGHKWSGIEEYRVEKDWILIQDAGQLGGLIGTLMRVPPNVAGGVVSNHLMRVAIGDRAEAAFVFALLASPYGYRAIVRHAFGSSIPQLDPKHIADVLLPWPDAEIRSRVAAQIIDAWDLEDAAVVSEAEAVAAVECAIEEAT